jgi:hypothetical protein
MATGSPGGRPIVIIGVSRRSGTNFLAGVLLCHRDCAAPAPPVAEDQLLRDASLLERYARHTARRWPRRWGDRAEAQRALERSLGSGLLSFLTTRTDGPRTVTRSPYTDNLPLATKFFADADLVLLVRDGRSVAASLVHGWHWSHDRAIKEWRKGARAILDFTRSRTGHDEQRFLLVRYEDLLLDFDTAVARLLDFAALDPQGFDHARASELPVFGSSYIRDGDGRLTWQPVGRPADFDPSRRYSTWSAFEHERFGWLAGDEQRSLGYPVDPVPTRMTTVARNVVLDAVGPLRDGPVMGSRRAMSRMRDWRAGWRADELSY